MKWVLLSLSLGKECEVRSQAMVAAISQINPKIPPQETHHQNPTRTPLLPSEKDNGLFSSASAALSRRPKTREVTSRYMSTSSSSTSSSRRSQSPLVSPHLAAATPEPGPAKRSQSTERRRLATPMPDSKQLRNASIDTPVAASKTLWTSSRRLSVSFQGESFSLPIRKVKEVAASPPQSQPNLVNARKATPERRSTTPLRGKIDGGGGDQLENFKTFDQRRWPGSNRLSNALSRSLDCTGERIPGASASVIQALQQSIIGEGRRVSFDGHLHTNLGNVNQMKSVESGLNGDSDNLATSDTESVSSGSNSGILEFSTTSRRRSTPRGISVPARFWQETNSRLRRLHDPGSTLSLTGSKTTVAPKLTPAKKTSLDNSKHMVTSTSSPSRGIQSPLRMRSSAVNSATSQSCNVPSILTFAADVRRGKMGENKIEDAHLLRLLYNRHFQWRFVNARTDASMSVQRSSTERNLYNAWALTSQLRDSVTIKRVRLQLLKQRLKLTTILKGQMSYLEEWALLDGDHSSSLSGAIEALKASTLRLPVISGARADIQKVKGAIGSAMDVMQAMASSICSLLSKVEGINFLIADAASLAQQEHALLSQCKDLLSTIAIMQVEESSLQTHLLQLQPMPKWTSL